MACWTNFVTGQLECDPASVEGSGVLDNATYQQAIASQVYAPVVPHTNYSTWVLIVAALGFAGLTFHLATHRK